MTIAPFDWEIVATLDDAKQAVAFAACEMGYRVEVDPSFLHGEASVVALRCVQQLRQSTAEIICMGRGDNCASA
jgi:hypothetical protein